LHLHFVAQYKFFVIIKPLGNGVKHEVVKRTAAGVIAINYAHTGENGETILVTERVIG